MNKYFEVIAKCGHVGKNYYYEGHFFIATTNARMAAAIIRQVPRVKHDHADAILSVREVNHAEYVEGCIAMDNNPYFKATTRREQDRVWDEIADDVRPETERQLEYRNKHTKGTANDRKHEGSGKYGHRNHYKFMKYNPKQKYAFDTVA